MGKTEHDTTGILDILSKAFEMQITIDRLIERK
jgi:hypothetical protein